jgi:hypothetical protein
MCYGDISDKTCEYRKKRRALGDAKMKKRQFLLPLAVSVSALISGTGGSVGASPAPLRSVASQADPLASVGSTIQDPLVLNRADRTEMRFADHESHSSHASHSSGS